MTWLESITNSMDVNFSKLRETVKDREAWRAAVHEVTKSGNSLAIKQQQQGLIHFAVQWKQTQLCKTTII